MNVFELDQRPAQWNEFDVVMTSAILEYIPRAALPGALKDLIALLRPRGRLVLCITRRDVLTKWRVGTWWQSNLYTKAEVTEAFHQAVAPNIQFHYLPGIFRVLLSSVIVAEYCKPDT